MIDQADRPIYTTRDIAEVIGCSLQYVREQVYAGALECAYRNPVTPQPGKHTTYRFSLNNIRRYNADAAERLERTQAA